MKRILCLILALLLLTPSAFAAESKMTFHLEGAAGEVGDTVTVVGSVKNAPVCASFRVIITYDDQVLEPAEGKKLEAGGLFIANINAMHEGKKAVNVLAADAAKVLEGDMDLFAVDFKIIGKTAEKDGSLLQVAYEEFFQADLSRVYPIVEPCRIKTGSEQPDTPDAPDAPDTPTQPDNQPNTPDVAPPDKQPEAGENPGESNKAPTGSWILDSARDEFIHLEEDGSTAVYTPSYNETPKVGQKTEVILKDESGKEAGTVTVEKQTDGTIKVIEQDLTPPSAKEPAGPGIPRWLWPAVGVFGALIAAAAIAFLAVYFKKKKEDGSNEK